MAREGGLGRGLASLIPQKKNSSQQAENKKKKKTNDEVNYFQGKVDLPVAKRKKPRGQSNKKGHLGGISLKSVMDVPTGEIDPNPHQPRSDFNEERLSELADSIKEHGIIQPVVVSRKDDRYELIAGERRLEAAKIAGLEKVPAIVRKVNDQNKVELSLIENIQRHNLSPIEEAKAYKKMQDSFALTQEEIALRVGKSRSKVANSIRLLSLPVEIQRSLSKGEITEGHARTILSVSNPEKQRVLFKMILKDNLSVRQIEDKVREVTVSTHKRRVRNVDPEIAQHENDLSQSLGTKVRIKKSRKGGQIIIDYYSEEDFGALLARLGS